MLIYNSLEEYKAVAKIGDIIALGGSGIIDGLKCSVAKTNYYTVVSLKDDESFVSFRNYRGKKWMTTMTPQQIGVIDKKTYNSLPTY